MKGQRVNIRGFHKFTKPSADSRDSNFIEMLLNCGIEWAFLLISN